MPAIPKVVFLYDNDALEVRYSDDSRLELSPCGAAMVFHPPSNPGEHPRLRLSQQLHKRTQFVTSEHKQRVLQALDFRNRFAKRPYLCEDLFNSQDVVSLYAEVDHTKWPKSLTQAKIDILPDGSRKVTSLDEFASLIVSPHGQDFSVCYLSKVSSEHASHVTPEPPSSSSYLPVRAPNLMPVKVPLGKGTSKKTTEAVVYPYSHKRNEYYEEAKPGDAQSDKEKAVNLTAQIQEQDQTNKRQNQCHEQRQGRNVVNQASDFPNVQQSCGQENFQGHIETPNPAFEMKSNFQPLVDTQSDLHPASDVQSTGRVGGKPVVNDRCSPLPHEISSISRSSSPDGLRMTIDSDTTLTHDMTDNETIQYRQRHSSPTQLCSNVDDIQLPFAKLVELKSSLVQASCSSTSSNHNQPQLPYAQACLNASDEFPTPGQGNALSISSVFEMVEKTTQPHTSINSPTQSRLQETCNSDTSHSITLCYSQQDRTPDGGEGMHDVVILEKPDATKWSVNIPLYHHTCGATGSVQNCYPTNKIAQFSPPLQGKEDFKVSSDQTIGHSVSHSHFDKPQATAVPLIEENHVQVVHSREKAELEYEKGKRAGCPISPRFRSSDFDLESGNKSSSKRKYIWTTSHASRNDCPKEWTHALMLALQGTSTANSDESLSPRDSKGCCVSSLPRPLPLTCPFQHTHRSALSQDGDCDGDQLGDVSSNVGIFQRGRLKVVLSEGIIYRLIPASGMTVVEIYPGDGSVLISQGAKALFFTHYIPKQEQLEERMYSLKSLPPRCSKEFRPIETMLKTASRFLHICLSWDKRTHKRYPPCWQKEMVAVVEPLSSSILEECVIDGLGKFTAYTNGRVRIVFDDRTSLNTVSDFSPRMGSTAKIPHSDLEDGTVRLLLPSGNYVLVQKNSSGPYSRYLKIASEWADWVNTTPAQRHKFYSQQSQPAILDQAAKLELKKINCFNYILENTFQPKHQPSRSTNPSSPLNFQTSSHKPSLPHLTTDSLSSSTPSNSPRFDHTITSAGHSLTGASSSSDKTSLGFLSVRQALAQTSNLIRDIEDFLEENKS